MVKNFQFLTEPMTNDLSSISEFRNIGKWDSKYWYTYYRQNGDYIDHYCRTAPDFTTTHTNEHTHSVNFGIGTTFSLNANISRTFDEVWWGVAGFNTGSFHYEWIMYSLNGGTSFANPGRQFPLTSINVHIIPSDIFQLGGTTYILNAFPVTASTFQVEVYDTIGTTSYTLANLNGNDQIYAGYVEGSKYYFVYRNTDTNFYVESFNGTTFTQEETLSITAPSSFDMSYQQYWKQGGTEIILDKYYLRFRSKGLEWNETAAAGTVSVNNAIVWGIDYHRINYLVWDNSIWDWLEGGALARIQSLLPRDYKIGTDGDIYDGIVNWGNYISPNLQIFTDTDSILSVLEIVDGFHLNTLRMQTDAAAEEWYFDTLPRTASNVEYWIYPHQTDKQLQMRFEDSSGNYVCRMDFDAAGNVDLYADTSSSNVTTYSANTWHKVQISVCSYDDSTSFYLDDVKLGFILGRNYTFERVRFIDSTGGGTWDIDALGIGQEGWVPYNKGIEQSLEIWDLTYTSTGFDAIQEVWGRHNIYLMSGGGSGESSQMDHQFDVPQTAGTFYLSFNVATNFWPVYFSLWDGTNGIKLFVGGTNLNYNDGTDHVIRSISASTWYDLIITFDVSSTWSVSVNKTSYGPYNYAGTPANFTAFNILGSPDFPVTYSLDYIRGSWMTDLGESYIEDITMVAGMEDWISNGEDIVYQGQLTNFKVNKAGVSTAIYREPTAEILAKNEPFADQYVQLYSDNGIQFYEGFVEENEYNSGWYRYYMRHGLEGDFKEKIDEEYTSQTIPYMMKDIIDSYGDFAWHGRGTNGDVHIFEDGLPNWGYVTYDGEYWEQKTINNSYSGVDENFTDLVQMACDTGGTAPRIYRVFSPYTVCSWWMASSDTTYNTLVHLDEDTGLASYQAQVYFSAGNLIARDGVTTVTLMAAEDNKAYHICCQLYPTSDTYDVYVNGILEATGLDYQTAATTDVDSVVIWTSQAQDYTSWLSDFYVGDSLSDAFDTLDSISPLQSGTYTMGFHGTTMQEFFRWADNQVGYITSIRPDNQVYWNQYNSSGISIDPTVSPGATLGETPIKTRNTKFSKITVFGGYVDGVRLKSTVFGDPNYKPWLDWFPMITDQTQLDEIAAQEASDKNVTVKRWKNGVLYPTGDYPDQGIIYYGTSFLLTYSRYALTDAEWYFLSVKYDGIINQSNFSSADSYLSPSSEENTSGTRTGTDSRINSNTERTVNNEQDIGALEAKVGSGTLFDPMTTRGDIIIRDATNTTARLGIGTNGQVLSSDGTDISWQTKASTWVGTATSDLNMATFDIDNVGNFNLEPVGLITLEGTTVDSFMMTEVGGELLDYGVNYAQSGASDAGHRGALFRIETRDAYHAAQLFSIIYQAVPGSGEVQVFRVGSAGDVGIEGDIDLNSNNIEEIGELQFGSNDAYIKYDSGLDAIIFGVN